MAFGPLLQRSPNAILVYASTLCWGFLSESRLAKDSTSERVSNTRLPILRMGMSRREIRFSRLRMEIPSTLAVSCLESSSVSMRERYNKSAFRQGTTRQENEGGSCPVFECQILVWASAIRWPNVFRLAGCIAAVEVLSPAGGEEAIGDLSRLGSNGVPTCLWRNFLI